MKFIALGLLLFSLAGTLLAAQPCDPNVCKLPSCNCMSTAIPKNLNKAEIPQLVFLTFDDAITPTNFANYSVILQNRVNPNGCPITMTFYVSHDYNDYNLTHKLYFQGNEIAVHSVTHFPNQTYWMNASRDTWTREVDDLREMVATFANIPKANIKGNRAPFLQTSGDETISALKQLGMLYDNSFPTQTYMDPPIWPYTMDYWFAQDCAVPPCPLSTFPGFWIVPMVDLKNDVNNSVCAMAHGCARPVDTADALNFLKNNFQRHYGSNKAPFGVYLEAAWFQEFPHALDGYLAFLDYLHTLSDVYIVSISKGLEWIRNPVPLNQLSNFAPFKCPSVIPSSCNARNCYYDNTDAGGERVMRSCITCPDVYPWLGNPLGIF